MPAAFLSKFFYVLFYYIKRYKKVKVTLVQALRLCTGRTAHRGSTGIALPFYDHGTRRGWGVSVTLRPLFTPRKTRYPLYRRLGGPQGRSGQVRKISPPTRIRSPDRPARSQSLYWLSYPAHFISSKLVFILCSRGSVLFFNEKLLRASTNACAAVFCYIQGYS